MEEVITEQFVNRIKRLEELLVLRCSNETTRKAVAELQMQVGTLDSELSHFEAFLSSEMVALEGAEQTLLKLQYQGAALQAMLDQLPELPPTEFSSNDTEIMAPITEGNKKKDKLRIPSVSSTEFKSIPQYIMGRMGLEKLNSSITELNQLISDKYALMKIPQPKMNKMQREIYYEHKELGTAETKGRTYVTEKDLKTKTGWTESKFKFDAVGRNVINVLRHLGRIKEVRGGGHTRIVLQH